MSFHIVAAVTGTVDKYLLLDFSPILLHCVSIRKSTVSKVAFYICMAVAINLASWATALLRMEAQCQKICGNARAFKLYKIWWNVVLSKEKITSETGACREKYR